MQCSRCMCARVCAGAQLHATGAAADYAVVSRYVCVWDLRDGSHPMLNIRLAPPHYPPPCPPRCPPPGASGARQQGHCAAPAGGVVVGSRHGATAATAVHACRRRCQPRLIRRGQGRTAAHATGGRSSSSRPWCQGRTRRWLASRPACRGRRSQGCSRRRQPMHTRGSPGATATACTPPPRGRACTREPRLCRQAGVGGRASGGGGCRNGSSEGGTGGGRGRPRRLAGATPAAGGAAAAGRCCTR